MNRSTLRDLVLLFAWLLCIVSCADLSCAAEGRPTADGKDEVQTGQRTEDVREDPRTLLRRAAGLSELDTAGGKPYRLRARFHVVGGPGDEQDFFEGRYERIWSSTGKQREEIHFTDYEEMRIKSDGKAWWMPRLTEVSTEKGKKPASDRLAYRRWQLYVVRDLLDFPRKIEIDTRDKVEWLRHRKLSGTPTLCCKISREGAGTQTLCLDASKGVLIRKETPDHFAPITEEYTDYEPWASRLFPRRLVAYENKKAYLEVVVDGIVDAADADPSLFSPPQGIEPTLECDRPDPPKLVTRAPPDYPEVARKARIEGTVTAYARIGPEGSLQNITIVRPLHPTLDDAFVTSLKRWRYRPSVCNGTPVSVEVVIKSSFTLN